MLSENHGRNDVFHPVRGSDAMQEQLSFLLENQFDHTHVKPWKQIPPPDELFIQDWAEYIKGVSEQGFYGFSAAKISAA